MNFLLHHHLAARDLGTPPAAVGAMLPDLWRMADRKVRAVPHPEELSDGDKGSAGVGDVLAGIEHHLHADRWFHAAAVFRSGEELTLTRLREARVEVPRIGLFAHILWELCLDGELVRRVGTAAITDALRAGFAEVAEGAADRAVELHHFSRRARSPEERAVFDHRMRRIFEELARGPWIDGYQYGSGIAARIEGVRTHLGLTPMDPDGHARLGAVADTLLTQAKAAVDEILATSFAQAP